MTDAIQRIITKYGVSHRLGGGMEADVYAYGADRVLKIYANTASLNDLRVLKQFYDSLPERFVPYALPHIETVTEEGDLLVTIERRLDGVTMMPALESLDDATYEAMMHCYLDAVLELGRIPAPQPLERFKLFDPHGLSAVQDGDWHQFLKRYVEHQLIKLRPYLSRDVADFEGKLKQLNRLLNVPYRGTHQLIHGDFFPGNLLIDADQSVTALLDFGLFTMWGDPLFDVATGWAFFDMYEQLGRNTRERLLAIIVERLGEAVRERLYFYVLIFSVIAANAYSPDCSDGHYQWCVANLNHTPYWKALGWR